MLIKTFYGDIGMAQLKRPIKAVVVGDVDVVCRQMGKYFDEYVHVGTDRKTDWKSLEGAQVVCIALQATGAALKQDWTTWAKDRDLVTISCKKGSEIPMLLEKYDIADQEEAAEEKIPASVRKAQIAAKEAEQMVEAAKEATPAPAADLGIESLDFLANIQKQVQQKLDKAQKEADEAMKLYIEEAEKVESLNARLAETQQMVKEANDRIDVEIKEKLSKAVSKETIKLQTEMRRKDKAISDKEKELEKFQSRLEKAELSLLDFQSKIKAMESEKPLIEDGMDMNKVVMVHQLLMLAHAVMYIDADNKWLTAVWKILQGVSQDVEITSLYSKFREAAEFQKSDGQVVMIPPMDKDSRAVIQTAMSMNK